MAEYNYVEVDVSLLTKLELIELVKAAVEDSIDTCKWSEDGSRVVLKFLGKKPAAFTKYNTALSTPKKADGFRRDVLADPAKKFQHDKPKDQIILKEKADPKDPIIGDVKP